MNKRGVTNDYWPQTLSYVRRIRNHQSGWRSIWRTKDGGVPSGWIGYPPPFRAPFAFGELTIGRLIAGDHPMLEGHAPRGRALEAARFTYLTMRAPFVRPIGNLTLINWALLDAYPDGSADVLSARQGPLELRPGDSDWFMEELRRGATGQHAVDLAGSPLDVPPSRLADADWLERFGLQINQPEQGMETI